MVGDPMPVVWSFVLEVLYRCHKYILWNLQSLIMTSCIHYIVNLAVQVNQLLSIQKLLRLLRIARIVKLVKGFKVSRLCCTVLLDVFLLLGMIGPHALHCICSVTNKVQSQQSSKQHRW